MSEYSIACDEEEIVLTGKDGKKLELVMRELDNAGREAYLSNVTKRMKTNSQGVQTLDDVGGLQSSLLTKCLFWQGTDKPVEVKEIQSWKAKTVQTLFEKAQRMAGLNEGAEAEAKND